MPELVFLFLFDVACTGDFPDQRQAAAGLLFCVSALLLFCHALLSVLMIAKYFRPVMEHTVQYERVVRREEEP